MSTEFKYDKFSKANRRNKRERIELRERKRKERLNRISKPKAIEYYESNPQKLDHNSYKCRCEYCVGRYKKPKHKNLILNELLEEFEDGN